MRHGSARPLAWTRADGDPQVPLGCRHARRTSSDPSGPGEPAPRLRAERAGVCTAPVAFLSRRPEVPLGGGGSGTPAHLGAAAGTPSDEVGSTDHEMRSRTAGQAAAATGRCPATTAGPGIPARSARRASRHWRSRQGWRCRSPRSWHRSRNTYTGTAITICIRRKGLSVVFVAWHGDVSLCSERHIVNWVANCPRMWIPRELAATLTEESVTRLGRPLRAHRVQVDRVARIDPPRVRGARVAGRRRAHHLEDLRHPRARRAEGRRWGHRRRQCRPGSPRQSLKELALELRAPHSWALADPALLPRAAWRS